MRYENLVFSTILKIGLDRSSAEDVYQQVWIELYRSINRIEKPQALPQWLIVTSQRRAYDRASRDGRMLKEVSEDLLDPSPGPDSVLTSIQDRFRVETALKNMGGRCERLLRLLFLDPEQPPYKVIARKLGIAVGSIGSTRARCLQKLRSVMEKRY